ncbi:DUF1365 domain-containing protein [Paenirhodobacter populi]|uniref:DUF1365 domain-containing protein n=1 Tax=Paenirhodobacter populi TaxID=2306993 RepID=A0A443J7S7_9RHOB|nr:DUF1365 domain-containing protein [Sinirhodobacter populi]RWR05592.1 DUF1365 domain-containing protein [Sinirhodobacter populi]RWR16547.1 DUF1365 domain-containing protein [Sinirhodobacter populi]
MTGGLVSHLAAGGVFHLTSDVAHARRGAARHAFRYRVDYLLLAPEAVRPRGLFRLGRFGLFSFRPADHGGRRGTGTGASWAWEVLAQAGLSRDETMTMTLMAQPRFLGFWFNPVSFWMVLRGDDLLAVIAEVNNTFGQRHSYLCHRPRFAPIRARDRLRTDKAFHVSPFQDIAGSYEFRFSVSAADIVVGIRHIDRDEGLVATMRAKPRPLRQSGLLAAALRRPGGALRILSLIYWQALRLRLKGVVYRPLPPEPPEEISR